MKVTQSFVIAEPPARLWEFFEQVDQVARCVPGVESVEVVDADNSKVRVTQSVGPMTATFDLKMQITEREPGERMRFTAVGRAVKGAAGNLRSDNTVTLEPVEEGTKVNLDADLAMGGVLGSLGQKVVAKQAGVVTRDFMTSLERAVKGEPIGPPPAAPAAGRSADSADATASADEAPASRSSEESTPAPAPSPRGQGDAAGIFISNDFLRGALLASVLMLLLELARRARS